MIPGIGPVLIAGPLVAWVCGCVGRGSRVGGLKRPRGSALGHRNLQKDSILRYESAVKADKFVLVAHGTADEVMKAKNTLKGTNPEESNVHFSGARAY